MTDTRQQVQRHLDQGLSVRQIAALLGVSTQAVYKAMKTLGIDPPSKRDEVAS